MDCKLQKNCKAHLLCNDVKKLFLCNRKAFYHAKYDIPVYFSSVFLGFKFCIDFDKREMKAANSKHTHKQSEYCNSRAHARRALTRNCHLHTEPGDAEHHIFAFFVLSPDSLPHGLRYYINLLRFLQDSTVTLYF